MYLQYSNRKKYKISPKKIIIQYSGTMNKKQGFEFLIPIIKNFNNRQDILWLFGGEGPTKQELINSTKDITNIKFLFYYLCYLILHKIVPALKLLPTLLCRTDVPSLIL